MTSSKVEKYLKEIQGKKKRGVRPPNRFIPDDQKPEYIFPKEAWEMAEKVEILVTLQTIYKWAHKYNLCKKFGGKVLIRKDKFIAFLNGDYNPADHPKEN